MNFIRCSILMVAATSTMGCVVSRNVKLEENRNAAARPAEIEVTSRGAVYTVHWPVVEGDSLRGWNDRERTRPASVAISDVQRTRVRELSGERTAAAVGLAIVGGFATWLLLIASSGGITIGY